MRYIWSLNINARSIRSIDVSINKSLRCGYTQCLLQYKLISQARACGNDLHSPLFHVVISSVGHSFVCNYSSVIMSLANLIMEIRDPSLFVDSFVHYELNQLVNFISTM